MMNQFRLASRELFNHYFRSPTPYNGDSWIRAERFTEVERVLFQKLVVEPAAFSAVEYGDIQPALQVALRGDSGPAMINREIRSGYWDYPLGEIDKLAKMSFICFFDWDDLEYRDNQYVCAQISQWPAHAEVVGKHILIESQYVRFFIPEETAAISP